MPERSWFIAAVLLQVALLVAVPATKVWTRATGRTVELPLAPVDPYDPARGYHLVLRYQISQLDAFPDAASIRARGPFFAIVREGADGLSRPVRLVRERPSSLPSEETAIRGVFQRGQRLRYGIETYYIPEADRVELEGLMRENQTDAVAIVRVASTGDAAIVGLRIGDRSIP